MKKNINDYTKDSKFLHYECTRMLQSRSNQNIKLYVMNKLFGEDNTNSSNNTCNNSCNISNNNNNNTDNRHYIDNIFYKIFFCFSV